MDNKPNDIDTPLSPEEIRAIGEIQIGPSKYETFLDDHYKKLIAGLIVAGLLGGGAIAWFSHSRSQDNEAAASIVAGMQETRIATPQMPTHFDVEKLHEAVSAYAATPSADTAQYLEAMGLLQQGHNDQGLSLLKEIAEKGANSPMAMRADASLATWYMNAGKKDAAEKAWKKVCATSNSLYAPLAYMCLGDMAKTDGRLEEARTFYKTVMEKFPHSYLVSGGDVPFRLALLEVDAPKPVAPPAAQPGDAASPSLVPGIGL